jgi:hypothetical protein
MTRPSFLEGTLVALAASLTAGALFATLSLALPAVSALRWVVALTAFGYLIYLLGRSAAKVGRVSAVVAWGLVSALALALHLPLPTFVLLHAGMAWLVRSLYFHGGLVAALADLGLTLLGLAAGVWALTQSGSLFLAVWSLMLVQAMFGLIPTDLGRGGAAEPHDPDDAFDRAHRGAEAALRRMHSA